MPETFEQLVARVNSTAFWVEDPTMAAKASRKRGATSTRRRVNRTGFPLKDLIAALNGRGAAVAVIDGEKYLYVQDGSVTRVVRAAGGEAHTIADGKCSCEDCFYRGNTCKHLRGMPK